MRRFGIADDLEPANNKTVFDYGQALKQARDLARGEANADTETAATGIAPVNVGGAVDDYEKDLESLRGFSFARAVGLSSEILRGSAMVESLSV